MRRQLYLIGFNITGRELRDRSRQQRLARVSQAEISSESSRNSNDSLNDGWSGATTSVDFVKNCQAFFGATGSVYAWLFFLPTFGEVLDDLRGVWVGLEA